MTKVMKIKLNQNTKEKKYTDIEMIGMKYHYLTELFDRKVCHGVSPYSGDALPVTSGERIMCSANAKSVLRDLRKEFPWASSEDIHHSIQDASQYSFKYLVEVFRKYKIYSEEVVNEQ